MRITKESLTVWRRTRFYLLDSVRTYRSTQYFVGCNHNNSTTTTTTKQKMATIATNRRRGGGSSCISSSGSNKISLHPLILIIGSCIIWTISWSVNSNVVIPMTMMRSTNDHPLMGQSCSFKTKTSLDNNNNIKPEEEEEEEDSIDTYEGMYMKLPFKTIDDETLPVHVYEKFQYPFPCYGGDKSLMDMTPTKRGILFQRPHKVGSTTLVGVVLRLSHTRAASLATMNNKSDENINYCSHRTMHATARSMNYNQRNKDESFLFSLIRDPKKRIISQFFHFVNAAYQIEPTDRAFADHVMKSSYRYYCNELTTRNYTTISYDEFLQFKGLAPPPPPSKLSSLDMIRSNYTIPSMGKDFNVAPIASSFRTAAGIFGNASIDTIIDDILTDYNLIGIMERMDETLVVLQMLFNLTTKEILYTRARSSGAFSNGWRGRPCFWIMKSFLTPGMEEFFNSHVWDQLVEDDLRLYHAVNASLDRTIEALGRDKVARNLQKLQYGLRLAEENCKGRIIRTCDEKGIPHPGNETTCYIWSEGCDHECINELDEIY